jgi:hypothetical protein
LESKEKLRVITANITEKITKKSLTTEKHTMQFASSKETNEDAVEIDQPRKRKSVLLTHGGTPRRIYVLRGVLVKT